jgi:CDP-glucose 4,6-dehydratase
VRGERPVLRSDGSMIRDYLYVEDGALAYLALAEQLAARPAELRGEAFNFSYEQPLSAMEMTRRVLEAMASGLEPVVLGQASHEIPSQWLSSAKARKVLDWVPRFQLPDGLTRTIAWYRKELAS